MALLNLVYYDQLFPRKAFRRTWAALIASHSPRNARRVMVGLLALRHGRACEAELATALDAIPDVGGLPELTALQHRFMPSSMAVPVVTVSYAPLTDKEVFGLFEAVAETGLPLCIYNNPATTHFSFSPELVQQLLACPESRDGQGRPGRLATHPPAVSA